MMNILVTETYREMSLEAARAVATLVRIKPDAVLGLATGNTPQALYAELVKIHQKENVDFSRVTTFNLDEYLGLSPADPGSFFHDMKANLFDKVNLSPGRIHMLSGGFDPRDAESIARHCEEYEKKIAAAGGIDLQILGIGLNGHIAFNEPGSQTNSRTRLVTLTERTRKANSFAFRGELSRVPAFALTMGIGTILEAKELILLASGKDKAKIVKLAVEGPVTDAVPASTLQNHPNARVIADKSAASFLRTSLTPRII